VFPIGAKEDYTEASMKHYMTYHYKEPKDATQKG
jgi:hypothetical protein